MDRMNIELDRVSDLGVGNIIGDYYDMGTINSTGNIIINGTNSDYLVWGSYRTGTFRVTVTKLNNEKYNLIVSCLKMKNTKSR